MNYTDEKIINCSEFEENLSDYLEKTLETKMHKAAAAHALRCPLCHSLLNEVKDALEICREIPAPNVSMTKLEARVLAMTMPETAMACDKFEDYLTDYLDGFLPAPIFHRWERHAVLCEKCTDLPGEVVRSIAACYTYKVEELEIPEGLHERILQATIGTTKVETVKADWTRQIKEWLGSLSFPIPLPQLAPIALILLFAVVFFNQTVSADGEFPGVYQKSFQLAEQTYQQSSDAILGSKVTEGNNKNQTPVKGTFVDTNGK